MIYNDNRVPAICNHSKRRRHTIILKVMYNHFESDGCTPLSFDCFNNESVLYDSTVSLKKDKCMTPAPNFEKNKGNS